MQAWWLATDFDCLVTSHWNLYYGSVSPPKMRMHQFSTSLAMSFAIALLELINPTDRITKELVMSLVESVRHLVGDEGECHLSHLSKPIQVYCA
jgi:hypothetical protein